MQSHGTALQADAYPESAVGDRPSHIHAPDPSLSGGSLIRNGDEAILVLRAQSGDREAFEALLRHIHAPLRAYLTGLLGASIADDAMQDTALQVHRKLRWLRDPEVFRAWVFRIASRIAFAHLKRERRWLDLDRDTELLDSVADTITPLRALVSEQRFSQLLSRVSPASRAVLLLHYEQDLSLEQIAAVLAIPLGTVKSRLQYNLTTLRKYFKEEAKS